MTTRSPRSLKPVLILCALWGFAGPGPLEAQGIFIRGDCEQDLSVNITDVINVLGFLYLGVKEPACLDACDADDSGDINITDAIALLAFLYLGTFQLPQPIPEEDVDPPPDDGLTCANGKPPILELRVSPAELIFYSAGEAESLSVIGVFPGDTPEAPDLLDLHEDPKTLYLSDRPEAAQVSSSGRITAKGPGSATITVKYRKLSRAVSVRVADSAGSAPVVRILAPPSGSVVTSPSIGVRGTVSDPGAAVLVNGVPAAVEPDTGIFQARIDLAQGPNRIEAVATGAGGASRIEVSVFLAAQGSPEAVGPDGEPLPSVPPPYTTPPDLAAPVVKIQSPAAGTLLFSSPFDVEGTVDDPSAEVMVNGTPARVSGGRFSARIDLPRGPGRIEAEAVDPLGNRGEAHVDIAVDPEVPAIAISDPPLTDLEGWGTIPEGVAIRASSPVDVRGTLSPPGMRVWVNGVPAAVAGGRFTGTAALERGLNRIAVLAETLSDPPRRVIAIRRAVLDLDPPEVEVVYPPDGLHALVSPITVAGRVRQPGLPPGTWGKISLQVNGSPVDVSGGGFASTVPLIPGINQITVRAVDKALRESTKRISVVLDLVPGAVLEVRDGAGQTAAPGSSLPKALVVRARDAGGQPAVNAPVTFRISSGDGLLAGGVREKQVVTDAAGEARIGFTAGLSAGRGVHVVTAQSRGRSGSPAAFITTVTPGPVAAIAAHSLRWQHGAAGLPSGQPLSVRALDSYGNPVPGVAVDFEVVSGSASLNGGARASVATGPAGLASIQLFLGGEPAGDERSTVVATSAAVPGARITFIADALVPGTPADTRAAGAVTDLAGSPLPGMDVLCVGLPSVSATTDLAGRFELSGVPAGPVLLDIPGGPGPGGPYGPARREVLLVAGRRNGLPEPIRLCPIEPGPRVAAIPVSEISGGTAAVAAIPGLRLEVAAGAAHFPGGSLRGTVTLVAANLDAFPAPVPDATAIEFACLVLPEGVRFDPPARLSVPNPRHGAGRDVLLFQASADAGGFIEGGLGRAREDRAFVETLPGLGLTGGGAAFFGVPGPAGGQSASVAGQVVLPDPGGLKSVPQREGSPVVGENIYAASGEFYLEAVDLVIRGRGLDYRFRRRYESRHDFAGSLGYNWEHEYADRRLEPVPGTGNLLRADGKGRFDEYLRSSSTGGFISPLGVFARLFTDPDGRFIEREPDGTRYIYQPLDGSGRAGRLIEIADRNGNRIAIARDPAGRVESVRDALERSIAYHYDGSGRIDWIQDFAGRAVHFTYDAGGDLAAVTGPAVTGTPNGNDFPSGRTVRYEYSPGGGDRRAAHNLTKVFAPNEAGGGPPRLVNHYDEDPSSPTFDRVAAQDLGGVNGSGVAAGGSWTMEYRLFPTPAEEEVAPGDLADFLLGPGGTTVVTDGRGLSTEIDWSRMGLATKTRRTTRGDLRPRDAGSLHPGPGRDPPFFETRCRYSAEGLLDEVVFPRGNRIVYERDLEAPLRSMRANVVRETHHPAPGGSERPAVTTRRFDPLFNGVIFTVPPRGNDPDFAPQNGGEATPERYATARYLDYQEGNDVEGLAAQAGVDAQTLSLALAHAGVALGQGDLNGDGDASGASGNVVRTVHPPVTLPDGSLQEALESAVYNPFGQPIALTGPEGAVTRLRYYPEGDPDGDGFANPTPGLNPVTGGYLAEREVDSDPGGPFPPAGLKTRYDYDLVGDVVHVVDGAGNSTKLIHNALGELVEYRAPFPFNYRRSFHYDANGSLVEAEIENFTANLDGFPLLVREYSWIRSFWTYDILDRPVEESREISPGDGGPAPAAVTRWRYDPKGNLVLIVRPEGEEERRTYDERDLLYERRRGGGTGLDPGGDSVQRLDYDENGGLVRITGPVDIDGDGALDGAECRHDGFDRLLSATDPAGGMWVIERDPDGNAISEAFLGSPGGVRRGSGGNVLLSRVKRSWDERGREYRTAASRFGPGVPQGSGPSVETRFFDRSGMTVRRVDPAGGTWTQVRDGAGRPVRSTDPAGNSVTREYDRSGNLIAETRVELSDSIVDPAAGAAGDRDYDAEGRIRDVQTTVYIYDALDRLNVVVEGSGRTFRYRYDSRDHVIHASDAVGTVINAGTDSELFPFISHMSPSQADSVNTHGNQVHFDYDGLGRLVRAVHDLRQDGKGQLEIDHGNPFNADGSIEEKFEWDGDGRLTAWVDDRGNRTSVDFDRLGRPRVRTEPDGGKERFDYDRAGNLIKWTDRIGTVISQRFDACGRPVERKVQPGTGPDGIGPEGTGLQRFEYDGLGRPTLAFDGNRPEDPADDSLVLRAYDSLGRLATEWQGRYPVEIRRDAAERPAALVYPSGRLVSLDRDGLGRVREISDPARLYASFAYLGPRRILARSLGNLIRQSYLASGIDGIQRPSRFAPGGEVAVEEYRSSGGERKMGFQYGHDRAGRRLWDRRLHAQGRGPAMRYDSIGRPWEIQPGLFDPSAPPVQPTVFTRLYPDGAHNLRYSITDFIDARYDVDLIDRMTSADGSPIIYDAEGNLAAAGALEFRHDAFGRLTRVLRGGSTAVRYGYDATFAWEPVEFRGKGRTARKEVLSPAPGEEAGLSQMVFLEDRAIEERRGSGGVFRQYLHAPDGRALAAVEGLVAGGKPYYFLSSGSGQVAGITDGAGALLLEVDYNLLGEPSFGLSSSFFPFDPTSPLGESFLNGVSGWEARARLWRRDGRFYSPGLGRFVTRGGPLLISRPLALNRYALLDPVNGLGPLPSSIEARPPDLPPAPERPEAVPGPPRPGVGDFLPPGIAR